MNVSRNFYENILAGSVDSKRATSLTRLKAACDELDKDTKTSVYTVADVGRYCELHWKGPKVQSIRNAPDVLEKYTKLRIAERAERLALRPPLTYSGKRQLNLMDSSVAQQQFQLALAEIEQLKAEVTRLKVDVSTYCPINPDDLLNLSESPDSSFHGIAPLAQQAEVLAAIRHLFDRQRLRRCELVLDPNGYLVNEISGNELLPASAVSALKRLIGGGPPDKSTSI